TSTRDWSSDVCSSDLTGIDAPNIQSAAWGDKYKTKIVLTFRDPNDTLTIDKLARLYFSTDTNDNIIKSRVTATNEVTLTLFSPRSEERRVGKEARGEW